MPFALFIRNGRTFVRVPRMGNGGGMTLVETTIAVSLMTAICLGTINVLISSAALDKDAAMTITAEHELQSAMDYVKSIPFASLSTPTGLPEDLVGNVTIHPGSLGLPGEKITVQYYTNDTYYPGKPNSPAGTSVEATVDSQWGANNVVGAFASAAGPAVPINQFPNQCEIRVTITWTETWANGNVANGTATGNAGVVTNSGVSQRTRTLTSAVIRTSAF
jgi:hypothetical protein